MNWQDTGFERCEVSHGALKLVLHKNLKESSKTWLLTCESLGMHGIPLSSTLRAPAMIEAEKLIELRLRRLILDFEKMLGR